METHSVKERRETLHQTENADCEDKPHCEHERDERGAHDDVSTRILEPVLLEGHVVQDL